jgi:hypothetical protein
MNRIDRLIIARLYLLAAATGCAKLLIIHALLNDKEMIGLIIVILLSFSASIAFDPVAGDVIEKQTINREPS